MGAFVPPHDRLKTEQLASRRWKLLAPLWFRSHLLDGQIIKAPAGLVTDLESVPWVPLAYWLFAYTANRAGVIHDLLYQWHKVGDHEVSRALADAVYREAAEAEGNWAITRWTKWSALRLGGFWSYRSGPERFQVLGNERRRMPRPPDVALSPETRGQLERFVVDRTHPSSDAP